MKKFGLVLFVTLLSIGPVAAQDALLVDLRDLSPRELAVNAFRLDRAQSVEIEAVGARQRDGSSWFFDDRPGHDHWPADAWILDAHTREVVWSLRGSDTDERKGLHTFIGSLELAAGVYEAYFASYVATSVFSGNLRGVTRLVGARGYDDGDHRYRGPFVDGGEFRDFRLLVRGAGSRLDYDDVLGERETFLGSAIVRLDGSSDNLVREAGFQLDSTMELEIYANGEADSGETYDYGWIIDADSGRRVWTMDWRETDYAGGAEKNRFVRRTLKLPAGRYAAFFMTDGSHSPEEWNTVPGYDPAFWGLTIRTTRPGDAANVRLFDYERVPDDRVFVSLVRARDNDMLSHGFTLTRDMDVRVFAMGEGVGNDMVDYGWILEAGTRRPVWTMDYRDTEHAGGALKNRVVDTIIHLEAGDYLAYYVTDGSHSFDDWNSSRPMDGEFWGLTLSSASGPLEMSAIRPYDPRNHPGILARISDARDSVNRRERFTLDKTTRVGIRVQGEGSGGDMYDYGWIEDAESGRVIWEMTYRMTEHAGGASKNRRFDGSMVLEPGTYTIHYRTDGSHSFNDWNSTPPHDRSLWGIEVVVDEQ